MSYISDLQLGEKNDKHFATFSTHRTKCAIEHVCCKVDGKWLDIDNGRDWSDTIHQYLENTHRDTANKAKVEGLRELYDAS